MMLVADQPATRPHRGSPGAGLTVWFSATAVVPSLRSEWGIGATAAVWLTASVQIGFVAGAVTSAVLNLADRVTPQSLLAASTVGAAACTAALALFGTGLGAAVPLRFFTGVFLAGVYPVGMKLMALVVRIHRSRPHVRSPDRSADPRLGVPPPDQRPRAAAVENCDAGRGGIVRGGSGHRRRSGPARVHTSTSARSNRTRATRSRCSPTRPPAGQSRLLRPHVGALRPVDLAVDVRRRRPAGRGDAAAPSTGFIAFGAIGVAGSRRMPAGRVGIGPVRAPASGGGGAGDQRDLLRGITRCSSRRRQSFSSRFSRCGVPPSSPTPASSPPR